jgi:ubiquinone/menaquinone biosynthesis C-methylase UbiE
MIKYYLLLLIIVFFISYYYNKAKIIGEHFIDKPKTNFKDCSNLLQIYDRFYAEIYDQLFYSQLKNQFEILQIKNNILNKYTGDINILDLGCGTGHHVDLFSKNKYNCLGIDNSQFMINMCKTNYPTNEYIKGNFLKLNSFQPAVFSHITCFFYTIYYIEDIDLLFKNINKWLKTGGHFIVHLVNKDKFDPVLEKSSSLIPLYNPQKYTKKTTTNLSFNNFNYTSDWVFNTMPVKFVEKFSFKNNLTRRNYHQLYMFPIKKYIKCANKNGFKLTHTLDLAIANHPHNYLFCFKKKYGNS